MKNTTRKFKKALKNVRMTRSEKRSVRSNLLAFMAEHPLRAGAKISPYVTKSLWLLRHPLKFVFVLLVFITIGGGTGLVSAAAATVPGDSLYGFKRATERVTLSMKSDHESRAEYAIKLTEERLQEAGQLGVEGKVPVHISVDLSQAIGEARAYFGDTVDFYVDEGKVIGSASMLVSLENDGVKILRGKIDKQYKK